MLAGQPESAGLQWGALSDEEEEVVAPAMDGYTSSNDSYGGHMGGFAFEGAVSEADLYEPECTRQVSLRLFEGCLLSQVRSS